MQGKGYIKLIGFTYDTPFLRGKMQKNLSSFCYACVNPVGRSLSLAIVETKHHVCLPRCSTRVAITQLVFAVRFCLFSFALFTSSLGEVVTF